MLMAVQKPLYHFGRARSLDDIRTRAALYFSGGCPPVPLDSKEGERVMLSNALAMNYGFAFRQATYASLRGIARSVFGASSDLVVDSPHNAIYKEEVDGQEALVHRHNTSRAFPASKMAGHPAFSKTGMPVLVPGTNRTCSYLCVPNDGADKALYSACHGTGSIISDFRDRGLSGLDPEGHTTLRFDYSRPEPEVIAHLDNRGVDEGMRILTENDIVRPVARLRPFAVLN
jgi:RNA-splicing ligase RtcB